jgi:hypothetical protein
MVFSNIGSISNSLVLDKSKDGPLMHLTLGGDDRPADRSLALRSHHVLLLSISSTAARLATGIIADYISPVIQDDGANGAKRRMIVRRSGLAAGCLVVLTGVFLWGAMGIATEKGLDVLSIGVGAMYGSVFTITWVTV